MNQENKHPVLGIDHGDARIGVAITDVVGILAHPVMTIEVKEGDVIGQICKVIDERGAQRVVLGLPLRMDGSEGDAAEKVRAFGDDLLDSISVPLEYQDERLTTMNAAAKLRQAGRNAKQQKGMIDQAAAVEILNEWMTENVDDVYPEEIDFS